MRDLWLSSAREGTRVGVSWARPTTQQWLDCVAYMIALLKVAAVIKG